MHPFASPARFSRALGTTLTAALSLSAGLAFGSPEYPYVTADELGMACTPDCMLCHQSSPGTDSPANKPFVLTLGMNGLKGAANPDSLRETLRKITATPTFSDDDSVSDVDELMGLAVGTSGQLTTDPNVAEGADAPSADICPPEPKYGCGAAHVTPQPHAHAEYALWAVLGGLLSLGLWRRFASRRPD
jgi:hypothetical protein